MELRLYVKTSITLNKQLFHQALLISAYTNLLTEDLTNIIYHNIQIRLLCNHTLILVIQA